MKMLNAIKAVISTILFMCLHINGPSQERVVIDEVIGVVGATAILQSELFEQKRQMEAQGVDLGEDPYCTLLDEMMFRKLLFNQAMIDSVEVPDAQIEQEIERRLRFFIQQIGSRERLEEYYGKTVDELREEFWDIIKEQLVSHRMESKITQNVAVTPSEVRSFFDNIPEDEIPVVESEMSLAKIMIEPPIQEEEVRQLRERLEGFRQRILDGESFRTLAILYSEDPGSARRGGELGFYSRGDLHPEFEAMAFSLRPGEISEIVETRSGYHIIELIERRGEQFNARHILLRPQASLEAEQQARSKLDSLRTLIMRGEMSFADAARLHSDHPGGRGGGVMVNPYTGTTRFRSEDMEPNLFFVVDRLEVGEISRPMATMTDDGQPALQIITVRERIEPHPANLQQDYDFIQRLALQEKRRKAINRWVERRLGSTYISIHENYQGCDFDINWLRQ